LPVFGLTVLTTPELDFSKGKLQTTAVRVNRATAERFDEGSEKVRTALLNTTDEAWGQKLEAELSR